MTRIAGPIGGPPNTEADPARAAGTSDLAAQAVPAGPLTAWLSRHAPEVAVGPGPVEVHHLSGGRSNLTFRIVDTDGRSWALRRPPLGGVLATAHDMGREWRFIAALDPTPVPVPRAVAFCPDAEVIGAPFYVMGFVDGVVAGDRAAGEAIPVGARRAAGLACAETLAALHAVDPLEVGLGDLRRPGGYLERQLRRWHRQVHASALPDLRLVDAAHKLLVAAMPADPTPAIVHGDFRPGNLAFGRDGQVGAVFDWELASLGDPLADLGWLVASWERPGGAEVVITSGPTASPGWPEAGEVVTRYAELIGDNERTALLEYFVAFALWRSACIGAGVYTRYASGHMSAPPAEAAEIMRVRLHSVRAQAGAAVAALGG
ncbi:putative aminoglycoside phosphotransferase [Frankia sp. EI5c]|uniref:phosphotransferase family protein n=1 Tax=Frankia sp. EI5c TaxID=683316 RepID=UPI0007C3D657|nr:phosphotransferase family protein [Frankia sp. EI5c]OAA27426.1 putative aminoglycoside phosphotransferase [Frankia sp. EI5c]